MDCPIHRLPERKILPRIVHILFFVNLEHNFRNSRQIVESTKSVAEQKGYEYEEGIVMQLGNFPGGCEPIFTNLFENALIEARKRTNGGILVIVDSGEIDEDYFDVLDQLSENWKVYHRAISDFEEGGNPYKFLQEGNVLIVEDYTSFGFDWTTDIVIEQHFESATYHDCNHILRCTTNLIFVNKENTMML